MPKPPSGKRSKSPMSNSSSGKRTTKPLGIMNEYHTEDFGSRIEINVDNNAVRGEDTYVTVSSKATAAERQKAVKKQRSRREF